MGGNVAELNDFDKLFSEDDFKGVVEESLPQREFVKTKIVGELAKRS